MQLDLFDRIEPKNSLKGVRICLNGTFVLDTKNLNKKLREAGAIFDRVSATRSYEEEEAIPPIKGDFYHKGKYIPPTDLYVLGANPNEESIKRYELNAHDGYKPVVINEEQLIQMLDGTSDIEIPKARKRLDLSIDYIHWQAPTINAKEFVSRSSSPLSYDLDGNENRIYLKEIYVPDFPNINTISLRQIIGNLGGYANNQFFDDTDIVMLSSETIRKLEQGEKDETIREIERKYEKSNSRIFNVQFTTEKDFLEWVKKRLEKFPDEETIKLMEKL